MSFILLSRKQQFGRLLVVMEPTSLRWDIISALLLDWKLELKSTYEIYGTVPSWKSQTIPLLPICNLNAHSKWPILNSVCKLSPTDILYLLLARRYTSYLLTFCILYSLSLDAILFFLIQWDVRIVCNTHIYHPNLTTRVSPNCGETEIGQAWWVCRASFLMGH